MIASRRAAGRPGAMLLEVVVALAIFVVAAFAVLSAVQRATAAAVLARDQLYAMDLAQSAIAKIEAGIARAETLNGPVPAWDEREAGEVTPDTGEGFSPPSSFNDKPGPISGWELEIRTQATPYDGLTAVTVVARRRRGEASSAVSASYSLTQFVRLGSRGPEVARGESP